MPKNSDLSSKDLEKKIDLLIKRFEEQKGIIDSYVKRERDWKRDKALHRKEIIGKAYFRFWPLSNFGFFKSQDQLQ